MHVKVIGNKSISALFNVERHKKDIVIGMLLACVYIISTLEVRDCGEGEATQGQLLVTSLWKCVDWGDSMSYAFVVNHTHL